MAISQSQVVIALRYLGVFGAGVGTLIITVGQLPTDKAHDLLVAWQEVVDGLNHATAGAFKISVIVGPVLGGWLGIIGLKNGGFLARLKAVFAEAAQPGNIEEKKAVMDATASMPDVRKVVPKDPALAQEIPNPKVTAS